MENFHNLKKVMKINHKNIILAPFLLFNRISSISQRNLTVAESLAHELTVKIIIKQNSENMSKIRLTHFKVATLTSYPLVEDG